MGVYIFMSILPDKIGKEEWEKVYEESLELINAYPFMDSTIDQESYDILWKYVHRATEKNIRISHNEHSIGWHVFGDYETLLGAESVSLLKDIEYYREWKDKNESCDDILTMKINERLFYWEEELKLPVTSTTIFDGKTQGFPHHIPLLAIACLIESRFPKYAIVWGDITIGQMKKAIDWANSILTHPIQLTERANNKILLERIRSIVQDDRTALKAFMALTMHNKDFRLGDFIKEHFDRSTLTAYYTAHFSQYNIETFGFHDALRNFFDLGFSIDQACDICVLDPNGCRYDAEIFAEAVLSMLWPIDKKDLNQRLSESDEAENETPDTVYSQFGRTFLKMAGVQEGVKTNFTSHDVTAILQSKLGHVVNIPSLLKNKKEKEAQDGIDDKDVADFYEQLKVNLDKTDAELKAYTISDLDDLILWKKGDSLHPNIEKAIKRIKDFVDEGKNRRQSSYDEFHSYENNKKIKWLIHLNDYFYIRKETWDYYIANIHQSDVIDSLFGLLIIKTDELNTNKLCKAIVNNVDLFKAYMVGSD